MLGLTIYSIFGEPEEEDDEQIIIHSPKPRNVVPIPHKDNFKEISRQMGRTLIESARKLTRRK
jgi:hypothetical protein